MKTWSIYRKKFIRNRTMMIILFWVAIVQACLITYNFIYQNKKIQILKKQNQTLNYNNDSLNRKLFFVEGLVNSIPISSPIRGYEISSDFGYRMDPMDSLESFHGGVDIYNITDNDTIYSTAAGRVVKSSYHHEYGNYIIIKHKSGFSTLYGHLKENFVKRNKVVGVGTPIGIMGETGRATGKHLHYEILFNESKINPKEVIFFDFK